MLKKLLKHYRIYSICLSLLGLMLVFIGGIFSANTQIEKVADYATKVVTTATEKGNLCAVTVQATEDSKPIADTETEFHNLYGVFRQKKITFATTVNPDREYDISITGISDNLSLLYVGPVGTKENIGGEERYRHYIYPIEMMFEDGRYYELNNYIVYISKTHATKILETKGVEKQEDGTYTFDDYETLVASTISMTFDGEEFDFIVQNIYYESDYYYDGLNDVMGDFAIVSYYLPNGLSNKRKNMYFMSDFTFQNKYFMDYINTVYSSKKYLVEVNNYNLVKDINEEKLLSFYYGNSVTRLQWLSIMTFIIGGAVFFSSFCLYFYGKTRRGNKRRIYDYWIWFALLFIPYLIFKVLYLLTNEISLLSETSSKVNGVFILLSIGLLFVLDLFTKNVTVKNKLVINGDDFYEVDI